MTTNVEREKYIEIHTHIHTIAHTYALPTLKYTVRLQTSHRHCGDSFRGLNASPCLPPSHPFCADNFLSTPLSRFGDENRCIVVFTLNKIKSAITQVTNEAAEIYACGKQQ